MKAYKVAYQGGSGELIEKKSKFIANVFPVNTEEEALSFLEKMKKQYWDATHNCYAYVIGTENEIQRCSDDGEPSGTAGKPMLDVLLGEGIHNVLVVVTRYFGGTLLGTGGLVRAYSGAVQDGLNNSNIILKRPGRLYRIGTDYSGLGKIQYIIGQLELTVIQIEYTDKVTVEVLTPYESFEQLEQKVTMATAGRAEIIMLNEIYYGTGRNKEPILFD